MVTTAEWDAWVDDAVARLVLDEHKDLRTAHDIAIQVAIARFGPRPIPPASPSGLGLFGLLKLALQVRSQYKMGLKFTVSHIVAAITAGATAFGVAYNLAATNATPGVQAGEWLSIAGAVLIAVIGALFNDGSQPAVK